MSGMSEPKLQAIDEAACDGPSSRADRRAPSLLGLSIISLLNVISLAIITYHFASHAGDAAPAPAAPSPAIERPQSLLASLPARQDEAAGLGVLGNVDLAPVPRHVLTIAAGIDLADRPPTTGEAVSPGEPAQPLEPLEQAPTLDTAEDVPQTDEKRPSYWVQLGALSQETTARRYWSDLKRRHAALLRDREPRIVDPAEAGGSLYHLRIGPMAEEAAAGLCEDLTAAGADCFCIKSSDRQRS